jgi:superfamily II DNA/RNA helicase
MCFATSMIEVGVDIDRLGLLTMFGQPKSASQYIQVAGRVGRNERDAPGVVFVVLSPYNNRDRSHFEQFSTFHRRLYASVEPVSITPFTPAALDRGLAGALTAWMRQAANPPTPADAASVFDDGTKVFADRVRPSSPQARNLQRRAAELRAQLAATTHTGWGTLQPGHANAGFLRSLGEEATPAADDPDLMTTCWLVPTSMRSVDAESGARAIRHTKSVAHPAATAAAGVGESAEEDLF